MTNEELANHLNIVAGLAGKDAVTVNIIRQWVSWGVLPKALPEGQRIGSRPRWSRDDAALQRAVRLANLRKAGMRREAAVIAQAYFDWGDGDIELARGAILSEFVKYRDQLNRRQTSFLGQSDFQSAGRWKQRAIENQLGPLDSRLVGTPYAQTPELYAIVAEASRVGEADISRINLLLTDAFAKILPEMQKAIPETAIIAIANSIPGLTGDPEEVINSGEASIKEATKNQFAEAREIAHKMIEAPMSNEVQSAIAEIGSNLEKLFELPRQLHPQISIGPWAIFRFAQTLHSLRNTPNLKQEIGGFLRDS